MQFRFERGYRVCPPKICLQNIPHLWGLNFKCSKTFSWDQCRFMSASHRYRLESEPVALNKSSSKILKSILKLTVNWPAWTDVM